MTRGSVAACAALLAITAPLAGCGAEGEARAELPAPPGEAEVEAALAVQVVPVETREIRPTLTAVGTAEPIRAADLGPQATGRIVALPVEEGVAAEEGQVLARLDTRMASLAASQAGSSAASALARVRELEQEVERLLPLAEDGAVPERDVDQLRLQLEAARASHTAAVQGVAMARTTLRDSTVRAPFAGVVSEVRMELGETATSQPPSVILRLVDLSVVEVTARFNESELPRLRPGTPVTVRFPALDQSFEGAVHRIASEVDRQTRSVSTVVRVDNPDGRIRGGLSAEVALRPGEPRTALVIPRAASRGFGDHRRVYVLADDDGAARAEERTVTVEALGESELEVLEGLEGDERVIAPLPSRIRGGSAVRVQAAEGAAASG
ncbi:MAG: efflux RND transporter periplasmic adaptor subunit [Sandaracinaceae bacterium]